MGRWTPLILMAGGLAILLGTLLGISFPLGGQNNAQAPKPQSTTTGKASKVLPANINVNSTAGGGNAPASNNNKGSVVQSSPNDTTNTDNTPNKTQNNSDPNNTETQTSDANQSNEPVRALW